MKKNYVENLISFLKKIGIIVLMIDIINISRNSKDYKKSKGLKNNRDYRKNKDLEKVKILDHSHYLMKK
jgi:hypothetical protein